MEVVASLICSRLFFSLVGFLQEVVHDVHGHGEDDGGVVLGSDAVQGLQVAELKKKEDKND